MKAQFIFTLTSATALVVASLSLAAESKMKPQEFCPVMGFAINKEVYADNGGKRVFFCCPNCEEKFKADPEGYLNKMKEAGFAAADTPKMQSDCPVKGGKINREVFFDHEGKRVYFCCADCVAKFESEPAKYLKKMESQGIELEKAPQPKHEIRESGAEEHHHH